MIEEAPVVPCKDHGLAGGANGYATAQIVAAQFTFSTGLHRKVFFERWGFLPEVVRHTCDNPRCIEITHLRAGTQVDNMADMRERGRAGDCRNFGTSNGRTVLTDSDVQSIRAQYVKGSREFGLPALSRKFGVGTSQIYRVVKGVHHVG